jgi:pyridoxine kinase
MDILSIQSRVAHGYVGNAAAVPALQRLGHRVWPVETTMLSNHLGYATHGGRILQAEEVGTVLEGLAKLGLFHRLDALLTGFLGAAADVAADAAQSLRQANPAALYCLDPVMGERQGGLYVRAATAETIAARLVPEADILLPNAFELDWLTGGRTRTLADIRDAATRLSVRARPGAIVVATGLDREDGPTGQVETLALGPSGIWLAEVPRLDVPAHGGGDLFAALFLGHYLNRRELPSALARAMDSTHAIFAASIGSEELALVESLDQLLRPPVVARMKRLA